MLSFRLGWRNLWRNGKRTVITLSAVAFSTMILIVTYGLMDGLYFQLVSNATNQVVGEAQVHAPRYLAERSFYAVLPNPQQLQDAASRLDVLAAPRAFGYGLVSQGTKSAGAQFWGVTPEAERKTFDLHREMAKGRFLPDADSPEEKKANQRPMVLGAKLARSLNADVGSEIVAVVQAADGSMGNEIFVVVGILKSVGENIDRIAAIITIADFSDLFNSPNVVHEIAFNSRGRLQPESLVAMLKPAAPDQDIKTWRQLLPQLAFLVEMYDVAIYIFAAIFFLAAGLGVLNTMLMATFERIREFGIQKAIGASPQHIVMDVCVEAFLLGVVSTFIGAALALPVSYWLEAYGLDLSAVFDSFTAAGVAFNSIWYSVVTPRIVLMPVLTMWAIAVLASLYPAFKAARINPVRAMTHV